MIKFPVQSAYTVIWFYLYFKTSTVEHNFIIPSNVKQKYNKMNLVVFREEDDRK